MSDHGGRPGGAPGASGGGQRPVFNGRYELRRRVGRGGMADVFLAHDQLLDRPVAVKVLFPEFAADPTFVERFRREAQAAANLNHGNIVNVYDWGQQGSTYYIVMEFVDGRSLADILRSEGRLHPDRAAEIAADVADALGFAHRNGVVHRDVKPGNILITSTGRVKVADFGIARAVDASTEHNLTQAGSVMGTATYFSPEQAQGLRLDPRSDLYSLGVVLYEMLTGRPPFTGDNPVAIAYKQVHDQAVPPAQVVAGIPPALDAITMQLLAKQPGQRYPSADDVRADLRRYREGRTVQATTRAVPMPDAATTAMPATAGGAAYEATRAQQAYRDATQAVPRGEPPITPPHGEPRGRRWIAGAVLLAVLAAAAVTIGILVASGALEDDDGGGTGTVLVPSVVNLTAEEAIAQLEGLGLVVETVQEPNDQFPPNIVFDQSPAANTSVEPGSTVTLRVSTGPEPVELPNLVGLTEVDAINTLERLGLRVGQIMTVESDEPEGTVVGQDPPPGPVAPGTAVRLSVAAPPEAIPVPNVVGLDQASAEAELRDFTVDVVQEASDNVPVGVVIRTDPRPGTDIEPGGRVVIVVSTGPSARPVPDVRSRLRAEAEALLRAEGFEVEVEFVDLPPDDAADGRVVAQDPAPGEEAEPGDTVLIRIGRAAQPTTTTSGGGGTTTTTTGSTTTAP